MGTTFPGNNSLADIILLCAAPVSYTHLDVYKRQVLMSALFILVPGLIGSTSFMIIPSGAVAILVAWISFKKGKKDQAE